VATAPVKGTPSGKAPTNAPSQSTIPTGKGPTPKGLGSSEQTPTRIPPRSGAAAKKLTTPSVNYDGGQESTPSVQHLGASGRDYADGQQQDKSSG
jgi:hypothetical protein